VNVQIEVSFYPLGTERVGPGIESFIENVRSSGYDPEVGRMSTVISGEMDPLMSAISKAYHAGTGEGQSVMVLKISNACPAG